MAPASEQMRIYGDASATNQDWQVGNVTWQWMSILAQGTLVGYSVLRCHVTPLSNLAAVFNCRFSMRSHADLARSAWELRTGGWDCRGAKLSFEADGLLTGQQQKQCQVHPPRHMPTPTPAATANSSSVEA